MKKFKFCKDVKIRQLFEKTYKKNGEFKAFFDALTKEENFQNQIEKGIPRIEDYANSLNLCLNQNECQQPISEYRVFLKYQNGIIFKSLKKCLHSITTKKMNDGNYEAPQIPPHFLKKDIKDIVFPQEKNRDKFVQIIEKFVKTNEIPNYFLSGKNETGKTFLTAIFCNQVIKKKDCRVMFLKMPGLANFYQNNYRDFEQTVPHFLSKLQKIPLLVIDDFGLENTNNYFRDNFFLPLLKIRLEMQKPIFLLSQFSPAEMQQKYVFNYETEIDKKNRNEILANYFAKMKQINLDGQFQKPQKLDDETEKGMQKLND